MATIQYLTRIEFDNGIVRELAAIVRSVGIGRALLVTDAGLAKTPLLALVREQLGDLCAAAFTATPTNPTEEAARDAAALYGMANCDGVVALGGGSPIDLAKAVSLLATHDGPLERFAFIRGGLGHITARVAPVVAVPTTAGTGSEVGRAALMTLGDGRKLALISPYLIPRVAVCDPELTRDLPPRLTAATGMDALTHCVETYLSPRVNPPADAIALDGAARAARWVDRAVTHGDDRQARWQMMMASLQGGLTFQKGLGAVHSMSHPLGGLKAVSLHHGTLNAVLLPTVLRFNAPACGEKYAALRNAFGLGGEADLADWVTMLNRRLGLPAALHGMGVTDAMVEQVLDDVVADHSTATNPRPLDRAAFQTMFAEAMRP